ncbi:MAG TPA: APC family permease [Terriglobales bacterium]|jgi:APA family basic amino acid/polyamine antiporter|nr:APC family permease [Terriglobales bacterium]
MTQPSELRRDIGVLSATALNMIDMIGVGPFITIPLIISAMSGPQAMLGWVLGAALAMCDGMVWAELGAAMPGSGGSYRYLKEIYGPKMGKLFSFLFVWQLSFSAPLSIATGCIGLALYTSYLFPALAPAWIERAFSLTLPLLGAMQIRLTANGATCVAIAACLLALILLYRRIAIVSRLSLMLWIGVLGTIAWVIITGLTHFSAARAFDFPPHAFHPDRGFLAGLGAALLVAAYDYWGYYNVCFLGDEVKDPARTIPKALIYSVAAVAAIYIVMNISILGVIPWRELDAAAKSQTHFYVVSTMMERVYGHWAGVLVALLIMWTAFASVFSLLLGYSRVPYAAAADGNYFTVFRRVHPVHRIPHVSLLALGAVAVLFCFLRLADAIAALVVIRIIIQFLVQAVGLLLWRSRNPAAPRPFRMWLYPIPALLAIAGFLYVLIARRNFARELRYAVAIILAGLVVFLIRSWKNREWPFGTAGGKVKPKQIPAAH